MNRLTSITNNIGQTTTFTYDALGRRTSMTHANGVTTTYSYDAASQLLSLIHQLGATTINSFSYSYAKVGNRKTKADNNGTANYTYDTLNRLVQATNPLPTNPLESFTYDEVGNRTDSNQNGASIFNDGNQLTEDAQFTYQYDNNGNLVLKTPKTPGPFTSYEYDAENKLVRVVTNGTTINYKYDGLGRRIEKEVTEAGLTNITKFIYDREDILLELDGSNNIVARYTHGPGIDEPLIMEKGGASFFYHADALGSITELTDTGGTVAQSYTYSSFGKIESQLDPNFVQPYTFTAREFDPETGLYFYQARYYDSNTGRFTSEDPLGLRGSGPNLYAYVANQPIDHIDPTGLASFVACRPLQGPPFSVDGHCFLIVEQAGQDTKILSLFPRPNSPSNILRGGPLLLGQPIPNDRRDDVRIRDINLTFIARIEPPSGICENAFDEKLVQTFNSYPITGYNFLNQNSNTFVGEIIRRSGATLPPGLPLFAPGINPLPSNLFQRR